jgi:hypothetical protein
MLIGPISSCILFLSAVCLQAQETAAPATNEPVAPSRGEEAGDYNVVQSWELGYRYRMVGGDEGKYQSNVNYGNGIRLLSNYLTLNSRNGRGRLFDEISLTTQGLGNDPYESATLRVQKNRIYRYDMKWRMTDYFNPGLVFAEGLHPEDLAHRSQDHDLVLFPQSKVRIHAGYSRNKQDGPALSTINLFDEEHGDIFTLFSNVKREYNSYRAGADFDFFGVKLNILRQWEFYKEDTPYSLRGPAAGLDPNDVTTLTSFNRSAPIHGSTPAWLVNLMIERRWVAVNGRFNYSGGKNNFTLDESAVGTGLAGTENRLIMTYGDAQRTVTTGDLNLSVFATDRVTITNNTSGDNSRIDGNSYYEQFDLASLTGTLLNFQFLGIRLITNSTDARVRASKKLSFVAGYRYVNREIRSIQSATEPLAPFANVLNSQYDHVHAGVAGLNWVVTSALRLHLETEIGRNDNPFDPVGERNYHSIDARLQYERKFLFATAGYGQTYDNNSIALSSYSSHSRDYFANASWTPQAWLSVDAGYSTLHLDTAGGVAFFAGTPFSTLQTGESVYISNIHAANLDVRIGLRKRADLYLGYNITLDTGDGRSGLLPAGTVGALLYNVQTFPLSFQTPLVRLTIPITSKIKWNAGYQYYEYREDFGIDSVRENYHAHTGYTSVLWAF